MNDYLRKIASLHSFLFCIRVLFFFTVVVLFCNLIFHLGVFFTQIQLEIDDNYILPLYQIIFRSDFPFIDNHFDSMEILSVKRRLVGDRQTMCTTIVYN